MSFLRRTQLLRAPTWQSLPVHKPLSSCGPMTTLSTSSGPWSLHARCSALVPSAVSKLSGQAMTYRGFASASRDRKLRAQLDGLSRSHKSLLRSHRSLLRSHQYLLRSHKFLRRIVAYHSLESRLMFHPIVKKAAFTTLPIAIAIMSARSHPPLMTSLLLALDALTKNNHATSQRHDFERGTVFDVLRALTICFTSAQPVTLGPHPWSTDQNDVLVQMAKVLKLEHPRDEPMLCSRYRTALFGGNVGDALTSSTHQITIEFFLGCLRVELARRKPTKEWLDIQHMWKLLTSRPNAAATGISEDDLQACLLDFQFLDTQLE
uniref:Uncharacterized protein n=1 Tax=Mycena chlorophos TaxID=658473 RepID=A0ABQ0LQF5_MYCCL|nr:predicted protein [Mycena chlorophos]